MEAVFKNENRGKNFESFINGNGRDIPFFIVEMKFVILYQ